MRVLVAAAAVLASASPALAAVLKVPSDDFPSIQSAVNAAQDGDTILVGAGTYSEDVVVDSKSNLRIRGKGTPVLTPEGTGFRVVNGSVVEISGFRIEGGGDGVAALTTSGLTVRKVAVLQNNGESFSFEGCAGVRMSRCAASPDASPALVDLSSSGLVVEKCLFAPTGFPTVVDLSSQAGGTAGSNGAVFAKNRIVGGGLGLTFGGQSARIEKNEFQGSNGIAIILPGTTDTSGTVISKNRISTTGASGIESYVAGATIERNSLVNGAIVSQGDGVLIDRNRLGSVFTTAITAFGSGVTVSRNTVLGAAGAGISADQSSLTIDRNRVVGAGGSGIQIGGGGSGATVTRNFVGGADQYGFLVLATPVTVTGNRARLNGLQDYADSNAEGVNTVTDNKFGTFLYDYME